MIKLSTLDDIGNLLDLSQAFCDESVYKGTFDRDKVQTVYEGIIKDPSSGILIQFDVEDTPVGFICLTFNPLIFSTRTNVTELAWYVSPEHRSGSVGPKLLKAAEYWAKEVMEADYMTMGHLNTPRLGEYYEKLGFVKQEELYLKDLTW